MRWYGYYLNLRMFCVASSGYVTRVLSRPSTFDPGQPYTFPSKTEWYSGLGQIFPLSYAHEWCVTADLATVPFSQISRFCPLTGIVEFNGSVPAGTLRIRAREYTNSASVVAGGVRQITRSHSRDTVDVTGYGQPFRRRIAARRGTRWVLDMFFENAGEVERMHTQQLSGEVVCLYLYTSGPNVLGQVKDPSVSDGPYGGQYAAYGRVASVEVTGEVDGLLEAVVTFECTVQPDAVMGTTIFTESEQDNTFYAMYPNNETVI